MPKYYLVQRDKRQRVVTHATWVKLYTDAEILFESENLQETRQKWRDLNQRKRDEKRRKAKERRRGRNT